MKQVTGLSILDDLQPPKLGEPLKTVCPVYLRGTYVYEWIDYKWVWTDFIAWD